MIMPTSGSFVRFDLNYNPSSWSPSTPFPRMPPIELQDWLHDIKLCWTFRPPALRVFLFEKMVSLYFSSVLLRFQGYSFIVFVCLFVCFSLKQTALKMACPQDTVIITKKDTGCLPSPQLPPIPFRCTHQSGGVYASPSVFHEVLACWFVMLS